MNSGILLFLVIFMTQTISFGAEEMDKELSTFAAKLSPSIKARGLKKVTVIDFVDLQNHESTLGKYIAEELIVDFVGTNPDFSVLDRANLKKILKEHRLTATGLIDPENAKRIGMFAGVDAIILGTIIPKKNSVALTARIVTTETAEIVGAAKGEFRMDENVRDLLSSVITDDPDDSGETDHGDSDQPLLVEIFKDLRVAFQPLQIIGNREYRLTMTITNRSAKMSRWVAVSPRSEAIALSNSKGEEFRPQTADVTGFEKATYYDGSITATEIEPKHGLNSTMRFESASRLAAIQGRCKVQLELLVSDRAGSKRDEDFKVQNILITLNAK